MSYEQEFAIMADLIFMVYLIWVSWQDQKEMMVVRYSHGLGLFAIVILAIGHNEMIATMPWECGVGFLIVLFVQIVAYQCKFYGMADVFVFTMCGLYFWLQKGPQLYLTAYVTVMAVSGCLLLAVQIVKRNVNGVCLRKSVAYIPYISVAFVLTNMVV